MVKSEVEGYREFVDSNLLTFGQKLDSLSKLGRDKQGLPNADQMRQIKVACSGKIRTLEEIIF